MSPRATIGRPLRAIDLFCGAGGLTEGLKQVGFDVAFALDIDDDSCATYAANHPEIDVECASITDFTPGDIARRAGPAIDLVVGGPSCQGFSTAGRRNHWVRRSDVRNRLWAHMLDVVEAVRPQAFLMENVPGMVYWKDGQFGQKILRGFRRLGYAVKLEIVHAADYGVPQRRRRVFLVGIRGDEAFEFPAATHLGGWRRDTLDLWETKRREAGLLSHLTVGEAIGDLPPLAGQPEPVTTYAETEASPFAKKMRGRSRRLRDHESRELHADHLALVRHVPIGGTWRDVPPHLLPDRFRGVRRTDFSTLLGRLDPALPAYTITTQFTNVTTGCFTHPYEDRSLSIREGARLQTFPDKYRFLGSYGARAQQIGNAVPPLLAAALGYKLALALGGESAKTWHKPPLVPKPAKRKAAPDPTDEKARRRMARQPRHDTGPEVAVRAALDELGLTYETGVRPIETLRRTADVLFRDERVAVFVDGCFWHGCPKHARPTKSHTKWWAEKIDANRRRDRQTSRLLRKAGWKVVRVWEHEDPKAAAARIRALARPSSGDTEEAAA